MVDGFSGRPKSGPITAAESRFDERVLYGFGGLCPGSFGCCVARDGVWPAPPGAGEN